MNSDWYCLDCGTSIDSEQIDRHEDDGHRVRGKLRPGRLLSNDPWRVGDEAPTAERRGSDDDSPDDEPLSEGDAASADDRGDH